MRRLALLSALCMLGVPGAAQDDEPHNVVVLLMDDVGVDLIGAYDRFYENHPHPDHPNRTPCIDRMAATGLLFRNAWTNPVCSPTRAQLLTGRHAFRTGVGGITYKDPENPDPPGLQHGEWTIPTILRPAGYQTVALGKWHLADRTQHPPTDRLHPLGSAERPWFHRYAGSLYNLGDEGYTGWTKTFGGSIDPETDECRPEPGGYCEATVDTYATVDTADDAVHLIGTLPEPFFLYVAFNAAHTPLEAPEAPIEPVQCAEGAMQGDTTCAFERDPPRGARCMVQWLDNEIGRVLCAIDDAPEGLATRTTIVLLSDNGTRRRSVVEPFVTKHAKGSVYEGGVHVPFVVRSPLVARPGETTDALVCSTDLFATVAEIAGVALPAGGAARRDSISFLPVLRGEADSTRSFAFAEYFDGNFVPTERGEPPADFAPGFHRRAIRDRAGYKLVESVQERRGKIERREELFDVEKDPHERDDLQARAKAGEEPHASHYAELRDRLDSGYPLLVKGRVGRGR